MQVRSGDRFARFSGIRLIALLTFLTTFSAVASSFNQQDDFQDGTTVGWSGNRFGSVTNIPASGPAGAGDAFLQTSVASFHLGTKNTNQWAGNYMGSGIDAIEMDLNHINPGTDRLNMRILLFGPGGTFASKEITANVPTNKWTHHVFGLATNDLVHVTGGTGVLNDTLAEVTDLLLRHDRLTPTLPGSHPPHVTATLGIDNIHAVPRRPIIAGLTLNGSLATLELTELVVGITNSVQTTTDLLLDTWSKALSITASSATTNVTVTVGGKNGFIRTSMP